MAEGDGKPTAAGAALLDRLANAMEAESLAEAAGPTAGPPTAYVKVLLRWDLPTLSREEVARRRGELLSVCLGGREDVTAHCVRLASLAAGESGGACATAVVCFDRARLAEDGGGGGGAPLGAVEDLVGQWQDPTSALHAALAGGGVVGVRTLRSLYLAVGAAPPFDVPLSVYRDALCREVAAALGLPAGTVAAHRSSSRFYFLLEAEVGASVGSGPAAVDEDSALLARLRGGALGAARPAAARHVVWAKIVRQALPPVLPGEQASVKVFNSSTFSDMHAERDLLNQVGTPPPG
jgi:hypothetical protein